MLLKLLFLFFTAIIWFLLYASNCFISSIELNYSFFIILTVNLGIAGVDFKGCFEEFFSILASIENGFRMYEFSLLRHSDIESWKKIILMDSIYVEEFVANSLYLFGNFFSDACLIIIILYYFLKKLK